MLILLRLGIIIVLWGVFSLSAEAANHGIMSDFDKRLLTIIIVLVISSLIGAILSAIKKAGYKAQRASGIGTYTISVAVNDGRVFTVGNVLETFTGDDILAIQKLSSMVSLPEIGPPSKLADVVKSFITSFDNKSRATYLVNTALAIVSGFWKYYRDSNQQAPFCSQIESEDKNKFESFLSEFRNFIEVKNADAIPHFEVQRETFYKECAPENGEFIVAWADRVVATSHRLVILSDGSEPTVEAQIKLKNLKSVKSTPIS